MILKKIILTLFTSIFLYSCQTTTISSLTISPDQINIKDAKINELVEVSVKLKNTGKNELRILGIQPSCSCTIAKETEFVISPQDEHILTIDYHPNELGNYLENIVIKANTNPPFHTLTLNSNVIE